MLMMMNDQYVAYLGFQKGGPNFRWPLVLTQREGQTMFSNSFLWWKKIFLPVPKEGHGPMAPPKYATVNNNNLVWWHFPPDTTSSTRLKAQTWPQFNCRALDSNGWFHCHTQNMPHKCSRTLYFIFRNERQRLSIVSFLHPVIKTVWISFWHPVCTVQTFCAIF